MRRFLGLFVALALGLPLIALAVEGDYPMATPTGNIMIPKADGEGFLAGLYMQGKIHEALSIALEMRKQKGILVDRDITTALDAIRPRLLKLTDTQRADFKSAFLTLCSTASSQITSNNDEFTCSISFNKETTGTPTVYGNELMQVTATFSHDVLTDLPPCVCVTGGNLGGSSMMMPLTSAGSNAVWSASRTIQATDPNGERLFQIMANDNVSGHVSVSRTLTVSR